MAPEAFDLRLAAPFVVLAEELHFGRAAQRLGTKQPALSQQIARLERQLGVSLVERGGGPVALTPAGARFLVEVRAMLTRVGLAEAAVRGGDGGLRLRLGAAQCPAVGDIVGSFVAAHPDIVVSTTEGPPTAAPRAVRAGEADAGFGLPEDMLPGLGYAPVARAPLGAATAVGHAIAARGRAVWADLEGASVVVAPPGHCDGWNRLIRTAFGRTGVRVREVVGPQIPSAGFLQPQIAGGALVVVSPSWSLDPRPPGVAWTVLEPEQHLELGVLWNERSAGESVLRFVVWAKARARVGAPAHDGGE